MKRIILVAIALLVMPHAFSSCRFIGKGVQGSGNIKTEKRTLAPFKSVEASGAYEVRVACQQAQSFEIEGDDNILPIIKTEVRDGVLRINNENGYHPTKGIIIRIAVPDLEKFASEGAGDIRITDVKNEKITITSTGAGDIQVSGQTKVAEISSTGAANINTENLHAERAKVTLSGAANVDVYASQQLEATVSGVGSVTYSGNPPVVNKHVSGIGSVNKKE